MKKATFLNINVPVPHKSSDRKAGTTMVPLAPNQKIVVVANLFAPDHDTAAFELLLKFVSDYRPHYIFVLGRAFHDEAFQLMAPGAIKDAIREESEPLGLFSGDTKKVPTVAALTLAAKESSDVYEERVLKLGKLVGQEILVRLVESGGKQCHLLYIPALEGTHQVLPPEANILDVLKATQSQVDGFRQREARARAREDAKEGFAGKSTSRKISTRRSAKASADLTYPQIPLERQDFNKLLGVEKHPRIHVLPFGSAIDLACLSEEPSAETLALSGNALLQTIARQKFSEVRLEVGKRKVMNPIMEAYRAMNLIRQPIILGYAPWLSNGWIARRLPTANPADRTYLFFSQIGMMFARERMNYGDGILERYATGFYAGQNVHGFLHGRSYPFLRGEDGRRAFIVGPNVYAEEAPGGLGRYDVFIPRPTK